MSEVMSDVEISNVKRLPNNELFFSCSFPVMSYRKPGIYRHDSACGELMPKHKNGKMSVYQLRVRAKNAKEIEELIQLIKKGEIQPEPGGSYDDPPKCPSYEEMEAAYEGHKKAIADLEKQRDGHAGRAEALDAYCLSLKKEIDRLTVQRTSEMKVLSIITADLEKRTLPFVSAKETARRINKVIDGTYS